MRVVNCIPIALLVVTSIHAATIHVPADQPTIQAGINAAVNGLPPNAFALQWIKAYGPSSYNQGNSVVQAEDGGYVSVGVTNWGNEYDYLIVRTNDVGDTVWTRTYGGADNEMAQDVALSPTGGSAVIGTAYHNDGIVWASMWLLRLDEGGDTMWSRSYPPTSDSRRHFANQICVLADTGYLLLGTAEPLSGSPRQVELVRVAPNGDTLWTRLLPSACQGGVRACRTTTGEYAVVSENADMTVGVSWISDQGEVLRSTTFDGGPGSDNDIRVSAIDDGDLLIACQVLDTPSTDRTAMLVRMSSSGAILWSRLIQRVNTPQIMAEGCLQGLDKYLYVLCWRQAGPGPRSQILRVDATGLETDTIPIVDSYFYGSDFTQTNDGGFIITGFSIANQINPPPYLALAKLSGRPPEIQSVRLDDIGTPNNVINQEPLFRFAYIDELNLSVDSVQVQVGNDNDWSIAENWTATVPGSLDSTLAYAGPGLVDGFRYYARMRIKTSYLWSAWFEYEFRMNSVPSAPSPKSPSNDAVAGSFPILWATSATDAENDPLVYDFAGFHDTDCVSAPAIEILNVPGTPDSTGGQVTTALGENCRYWWKVRAYDGFEYSDWSTLAQFRVDGAPEAPTVPMLTEPPLPDGKPVFTLLPTLKWTACTDPDPFDTVRYKVEVSLNPSFSFVFSKDSLLQPLFTLTDSLFFATHYWWRVTAKDKTGHAVMSASAKDFWTWALGDLDHSHLCDLSDLSGMVSYLTGGGYVISPKMVGDLNGSCLVDLTDLSYMVSYLTGGGVKFKPGCE